MTLSSNINTYSDIAAVLEQAHSAGQFARYRLASPGKARYWMHRANKYRLLLQDQVRSTSSVKGFQPPTPYDRMKLTLSGPTVLIDFNPQPEGDLVLESGETIKPQSKPDRPAEPSSPPAAEGSLQELALQLARDLSNED